jgi:hypothetical protein
LRQRAGADLAAAQARHAELAAKHRRLNDAVVAAERELSRVEEATRWHRQHLAAAERRVDQASRDRAAAEWRLDHSPLLQRRQARREVAAAENDASWANHQLDQARARAGPHVERYDQATANDASAALDLNRFYARRVDRTLDSIRDLQQRCAALDTWRRWAAGAAADEPEVDAVIDTLLTATGPDAHHFRALGHVMLQGAKRDGIDVPSGPPRSLTRQIVGPDLGR